MAKYRKKPVVLDAIQFNGHNDAEIWEFCPMATIRVTPGIIDKRVVVIPTLEGDMTAQAFDWIIKGTHGQFYPCKPDIFEATYEEVS